MTNTNQEKSSWLVLLYVAADDLSLDNLSESTLADECDKMLATLVSGATIAQEVTVVALTDDNLRADPKGKYKYIRPAIRVREENTWRDVPIGRLDEETQLIFSLVDSKPEIDTGTPRTLAYFIRWALREYPQATHTMLSIIGHGGGWSARLPDDSVTGRPQGPGAGRTEGTSRFQSDKGAGHSPSLNGLCPDSTSNIALSTLDLRDALVFGLNGRKLDVLFLDSCLMAMIEVAYELRDYVGYLVAGETLLWSQLPYNIYLDKENLNSSITPQELARRIVQLYNSKPGSAQKSWVISAINLGYIGQLQEQIEQFANELIYLIKRDEGKAMKAIARAYHKSQQFDYNADLIVEQTESYVDIFDFSTKISEQFNDDNQFQSIRVSAASSDIVNTATAIRNAATANGRRHRIVEHDSATTRNGEPLLNTLGIDPERTIISSLVQTDMTPPNEHEKQVILVDNAYGLSIYFPMGEVFDPIIDSADDTVSIDDAELKKGLELRLKRYTSQLSFAKASPSWVELLGKLPQILETNDKSDQEALREELKEILLSTDAAAVTGDAVVLMDASVSEFARYRKPRTRFFCAPRQRA